MRTCILNIHSSVNEDLFQLTLPNHANYAGRHGYDMLCMNRSYEEAWYGCEDYVLTLLRLYDRVLTVGSDIIFTCPELSLERFDNGRHSVFIGAEGLNSSPVNFDMVLWKGAGAAQVIDTLRLNRPMYKDHPWGLQMGMALLARMPDMAELLKVYPPRYMQSAPFPNQPGTWESGDFALHFVGMPNKAKFDGCRHFLTTGEVLWRPAVGRNDHPLCNK